jgi:hypothetical protein
MIIDIEARVQLDKQEFEATTKLIREFVERNRHVTRIELASDDVHRQTSDGVFDYIDRVGMRVKVQAYGKIGVDAVMDLLEKLGAERADKKSPRFSELTDWVRAQPEGAKLLAVFREEEPIPAVYTPDVYAKILDHCQEYALHARMLGGYGYAAVWLSRETCATCVNRIPQGIDVYREGEP